MPGLLDRLRRLAAPQPETPADDEVEHSQPLGVCRDRHRVTVTGTLVEVTPRGLDEAPGLTARLEDGSGSVTLVWMGRRAIGGIGVGARIEVEGRIGMQDTGRCIYNPRYRLLRTPPAA